MDILERSKSEKLHYIRVLMELSRIDGEMHTEELKVIKYVAQTLGLKQEEIREVLGLLKTPIELPVEDDHKIELLNDLVMLMVSDNKIELQEFLFCKKTALQLGIHPEIINDTIESLLNNKNILPHLDRRQIFDTYMNVKAQDKNVYPDLP